METLGIAAIVRNEARYLQEWVAFHALQGVRHFRLYDNGSNDGTAGVVRKLGKHLSIQCIPWPDESPFWLQIQREAFLDAATILAPKVKFVAFVDIDEFLFALPQGNLIKVLDGFAEDVSAIAVNQRLFGSSGQRSYSPDLVTSRFVQRASDTEAENRCFKTIARPQCIKSFDSSHSVELYQGRYIQPNNASLQRSGDHPGVSDVYIHEPLIMHHYMLKSWEEYLIKKSKWSDRYLSYRYTDEYFTQRDARANCLVDLTLANMRPLLLRAIAALQAGRNL